MFREYIVSEQIKDHVLVQKHELLVVQNQGIAPNQKQDGALVPKHHTVCLQSNIVLVQNQDTALALKKKLLLLTVKTLLLFRATTLFSFRKNIVLVQNKTLSSSPTRHCSCVKTMQFRSQCVVPVRIKTLFLFGVETLLLLRRKQSFQA